MIGVDIFGQPGLFQGQYKALLHGYAAEAVAADQLLEADNKQVTAAFQRVARMAQSSDTEKAGKFSWGDNWVHLFQK